MNFDQYLKNHPYLAKQIGIVAFSVFALTVTLSESKLEVEHRFYRDDLPAHIYIYESPLTSIPCVAGTTSSALSMQLTDALGSMI